jgi:hypothetical protein
MDLIKKLTDFTMHQTLFAPLDKVAAATNDYRQCNELTDEMWLEAGVTRVLSDQKTGRGFLQQVGPQMASCPAQSHYFETLKSERRLKVCQAANEHIANLLQGDPFEQYPTLAKFALHAADGHWHGAAMHDEKIDERHWAVGHLYAQNLRTQALHHLTLCEGKKENDIHAIKRLGAERLRMKTPKGQKVLWVYDRACIDFTLWHYWKQQHGVYFITRTKENMLREVIGETPFDEQDPINQGVGHDQLIQTSQHVMVRMITYTDAVSGQSYEFITTEMTLAPGLIAYLYLRRWDIEKTYDQFKNKYYEQKAWASSDTAKQMQAEFICLAHNLLQLFNTHLENDHGLTNQAEEARRAKRLAQMKDQAQARGTRLPELVEKGARRLTQISLKLLRWLRAHWFSPLPLRDLLPALTRSYSSL